MRLIKLIYWRLPAFFFIQIFNLRRIQLKSPIRLALTLDHRIFQITDLHCNLKWYCHRDRLTLYSDGLITRAIAIGQAYGLNAIEIKNGDLVIDCGANMGDLQLYLHLVRQIKVKYIGFEPSPLDFVCLTKNNIFLGELHQVALFNLNSSIEFYLEPGGANSSAIEPPFFIDKTKVEAVRLDSIIAHKEVNLLKIEAEGAEPEVLEGSTEILSQVKFIAVDTGPERGINQDDTLAEVKKFCTEHGFYEIGNQNSYRRIFENSNFRPID